MGKLIQDAERLEYPCLYEKGNKGCKERYRKENSWRAAEQFFIVF